MSLHKSGNGIKMFHFKIAGGVVFSEGDELLGLNEKTAPLQLILLQKFCPLPSVYTKKMKNEKFESLM